MLFVAVCVCPFEAGGGGGGVGLETVDHIITPHTADRGDPGLEVVNHTHAGDGGDRFEVGLWNVMVKSKVFGGNSKKTVHTGSSNGDAKFVVKWLFSLRQAQCATAASVCCVFVFRWIVSSACSTASNAPPRIAIFLIVCRNAFDTVTLGDGEGRGISIRPAMGLMECRMEARLALLLLREGVNAPESFRSRRWRSSGRTTALRVDADTLAGGRGRGTHDAAWRSMRA